MKKSTRATPEQAIGIQMLMMMCSASTSATLCASVIGSPVILISSPRWRPMTGSGGGGGEWRAGGGGGLGEGATYFANSL